MNLLRKIGSISFILIAVIAVVRQFMLTQEFKGAVQILSLSIGTNDATVAAQAAIENSDSFILTGLVIAAVFSVMALVAWPWNTSKKDQIIKP
jgi:hypothetical protein